MRYANDKEKVSETNRLYYEKNNVLLIYVKKKVIIVLLVITIYIQKKEKVYIKDDITTHIYKYYKLIEV